MIFYDFDLLEVFCTSILSNDCLILRDSARENIMENMFDCVSLGNSMSFFCFSDSVGPHGRWHGSMEDSVLCSHSGLDGGLRLMRPQWPGLNLINYLLAV